MSEEFADKASAWVKRAVDTLFISNPQGTSLGILTGVVLHGLLAVADPVLSTIKAVRFAAIQFWHLSALGIVCFNIKPYLTRSKVDPRMEETFRFIEQKAEQLQLPEWQRRKMYENLFAKVLADVVLDASTRGSLEVMRQTISEPPK